VIDKYAAVSPPEFFAVATESFFEKPVQMKDKLPDLYEQLEKFYGLDPASWRGNTNL
jgi:Mlc titration factor MtfA (ptsG expression regulator)